MENTGSVLFEDDHPQWYVALGERWIGPLTALDVFQKVTGGEITWAHYVWKKGQAEWSRICDTPPFQGAVPKQPDKDMKLQVKQALQGSQPPSGKGSSKSSARRSGSVSPPPFRKDPPPPPTAAEKMWFLYYNSNQFGPFSGDEILRFLEVGKIHTRVHIWRNGMENWERIEKVPAFKDAARASAGVSEAEAKIELEKPQGRMSPRHGGGYKTGGASAAASAAKEDKRDAPRRPVVAKIVMANEETVIVGVCRDISVGGMQVLCDRVPGAVGSRIKVNVSPSGSSPAGTKGKRIEPFVANGVIVRLMEDGRGFSFRFDTLTASAKRAIEAYFD